MHRDLIFQVLTSDTDDVNNFPVIEPNINFSDHLPIMLNLIIGKGKGLICSSVNPASNAESNNRPIDDGIRQWQMRWDKADIAAYYHYTGAHLTPLINVSVPPDIADCIEYTYDSIVSTLNSASSIFVPRVKKAFYRFWWNEELNILKQASVESDKQGGHSLGRKKFKDFSRTFQGP